MAISVSPNVQVNVSDNDFVVPSGQTSLPIVYLATKSEKLQQDGITPALGTYEYGVLRTVTSLTQALQLYGVPSFLVSASGQPQHGDCRNEYGLDALCQFLSVGNSAYVVRANVNLDDNFADIQALFSEHIATDATYLSTLITNYLTQYNALNNYVPADTDSYAKSISKSVMTTLVAEAISDTLNMANFSSDKFANAFLLDHTITQPGYQDVVFSSYTGYISASDITGLAPTTTYQATATIVCTAGTEHVNFAYTGADAVTFGDLVAAMNATLGSNGTAQIIQGRIRVTSSLSGATSSVTIVDTAVSGTDSTLFSSCNLFSNLATPIAGSGAATLSTYNTGFTAIEGSYDGLYAIITDWTSGSITTTTFTAAEAAGVLTAAAAAFETTKQFLGYTALGYNDATKRATIVAALNAMVNTPTTGATLDTYEFDLAVCPGFPEVAPDLVVLSQAKYEEVQIIGETPFTTPPTGPNGLVTWATSGAKVSSFDTGYYYPHGLTSNIDGSTIMSSASSIALRTYAYSDSVSPGPWFAAAGETRGLCPQVTDVGYVSGTLGGPTTFVSNHLDLGTRNQLFPSPVSINPITFFNNTSFVVWGDVTTNPIADSQSRVNVARFVKLIKRDLRKALYAYLFEPNDATTWANVTATCNNYLSQYINRRALYDFAVVCDASNNVASTIQLYQLFVAIALKVTYEVDFIVVDIDLVDLDADIGTNTTV